MMDRGTAGLCRGHRARGGPVPEPAAGHGRQRGRQGVRAKPNGHANIPAAAIAAKGLDPLQVPLAKRDEVVEALSANAPDQSFDITVRGRRPDRSFQHPDAEALQFLIHSRGEDAVPVVD